MVKKQKQTLSDFTKKSLDREIKKVEKKIEKLTTSIENNEQELADKHDLLAESLETLQMLNDFAKSM